MRFPTFIYIVLMFRIFFLLKKNKNLDKFFKKLIFLQQYHAILLNFYQQNDYKNSKLQPKMEKTIPHLYHITWQDERLQIIIYFFIFGLILTDFVKTELWTRAYPCSL